MEEWTFLLQKDGDRSWLPLDTPDVEILEGRYRIVARTKQPNADIHVRICHLATEEDPPKRRIQKRTHRTNSDGLMIVTPFTRLQPGSWELSCFAADVMSDLVGDTKHQSVRLQVLPQVCEAEDGWEASLNENASAESAPQSVLEDLVLEDLVLEDSVLEVDDDAAETQSLEPSVHVHPPVEMAPSTQDLAALNVEIAEALGLSMERLLEMTESLSHQLLDEVFHNFELSPAPMVQPETAQIQEQAVEQATRDSVDAGMLRIVLEQEVLIAELGQVVSLSGRLELDPFATSLANSLHSNESLEDTIAPHSHALQDEARQTQPLRSQAQALQVSLRDPQNSQLLVSDRQALIANVLPLPFRFEFTIPTELNTRLVVGEVTLYGSMVGESEQVPLKSQSFTITVDTAALLQDFEKVNAVLAHHAESEDLADLADELCVAFLKAKKQQALDLSFLNFTALSPDLDASTAAAIATPPVRTPSQRILPPQIHSPSIHPIEQAAKKRLELPIFRPKGSLASVAVQEPEAATADAPSQDWSDLSSLVAAMPTSFEEQLAAVEMHPLPLAPELGQAGENEESVQDLQAIVQPAEPKVPSPVEAEFQSLKLQDRFLNRLNSLATDSELVELLRSLLPPEPPQPAIADETSSTETPLTAQPTTQTATEATMDEVVVEDEDLSWRNLTRRTWMANRAAQESAREILENPFVLPEDQPVPVPTIEVLSPEIVAGQPISVRVKLPDLAPKIYVKLWINDRQTRSLLDGPRWLIDLLPNGFGELEAVTQISAPFGSLDIRLEAIAVEMQTQRESQKTTCDRVIQQPDLPEDELWSDLVF
jgi:hypothetical protein